MNYDGIVIGGGAAGMFAAITAARQGQKVLLLERNDRLGKKLLITGKGRCNVTNNCTSQEVLQNTPRNGRFLYSAMTAFPPEKAMAFFEEGGCELKTERGNRVFPVTDKSHSVLECLQRELRRGGVTVKTARVKEILTEDGVVQGVKTQDGREDISEKLLAAFSAYKSYYDSSIDTQHQVAQKTVTEALPAVKPAAKEVKTADEYYGIQIFGLRRLLQKGDPSFKGLDVHHVKTPGSDIIRYVTGKWKTSAAASKNLESVRKKFPDAYMVQVSGDKITRVK